MDIRNIKNVHFIAIGGSVMHNLALALSKKDIRVTGADDEIYEPAASKLKLGGIEVSVGWDPSKVNQELDLVILGMHAKADNPELGKAKELGLPIYSFPEFIRLWSENKQRIVIGGSHGKSTITAMLMHVLKQSKKSFDYMVGAEVAGFPLTVSLSDAPIIVLEGDEYLASKLEPVAKFLKYDHHIGLISGIAWDHKNVFPTFNEYTKQFDLFADKTPKAGTLVYNEEDDLVNIVASKEREDIKKVPYRAHDAIIKSGKTFLKTKEHGEIGLRVFGSHNLQNISAALEVSKSIGLTEENFYKAIASFEGAKNRLELVLENNGSKVFKDYAHSPSKAEATVNALKKQFNDAKVIIAYELHTFSSLNKDFIQEYKGSLDNADLAIVYLNPKNLKINDAQAFTEVDIQKAFGNDALIFIQDDKALLSILEKARDIDKKQVYAFLSSGKFNNLNLEETAEKLIS
jgi:UDP-N-acetylmuramate: L-alanyl-gamma-D-glutamyl-meso-diaminopimelate ligase